MRPVLNRMGLAKMQELQSLLDLYGFERQNPSFAAYSHPSGCFLRGHPELLNMIQPCPEKTAIVRRVTDDEAVRAMADKRESGNLPEAYRKCVSPPEGSPLPCTDSDLMVSPRSGTRTTLRCCPGARESPSAASLLAAHVSSSRPTRPLRRRLLLFRPQASPPST